MSEQKELNLKGIPQVITNPKDMVLVFLYGLLEMEKNNEHHPINYLPGMPTRAMIVEIEDDSHVGRAILKDISAMLQTEMVYRSIHGNVVHPEKKETNEEKDNQISE